MSQKFQVSDLIEYRWYFEIVRFEKYTTILGINKEQKDKTLKLSVHLLSNNHIFLSFHFFIFFFFFSMVKVFHKAKIHIVLD